jgi:hypothetical protein
MSRRVLDLSEKDAATQMGDDVQPRERGPSAVRSAPGRMPANQHDTAKTATEEAPVVPRAYPPETILTAAQLAMWLQVSEAQVQRMNLPGVRTGKRRWRYIAGQVLDELKRRSE